MHEEDNRREEKLEAHDIRLGRSPMRAERPHGKIYRWLDNFWYHHKWKTLIIAFFAVVVLVCALQMCGKEDEGDVAILMVGPYGFATEQSGIGDLQAFLDKTLPQDYDVIVTGDLGYEGGAILKDLLRTEGYDLGVRYQDCGQIIFERQTQDTHAGGSGCGCSAVVMASYFLPKLQRGEIQKMIFMGTGAMMSPSSIQQGLAIPGIAHLMVLECPKTMKNKEK